MLAITPTGRIAVNAEACRVLRDAGVKQVVLLWDPQRKKMAMRGTAKADKHGFAITFGGSSGTIGAKSFLRHVGWSASRRVTLPASWNASARMFEVVLPPEHVHSGAARRRRGDGR
jgi:hypothetical protein